MAKNYSTDPHLLAKNLADPSKSVYYVPDASLPCLSCGDENPFNLIPKKKLTLFTMKKTEAVYLGQPIDKLSTLIMDEVPGGLLIQVTGMAQKTGIYDGRLIPLDSPDTSVLEFRFDVIQPTDAAGGPTASRTITVAAYLTDQDLETVSTIRVRGANNTLTKRR